MNVAQTDPSFSNMIELAEIITDRSAITDTAVAGGTGKAPRKRISKTSMLLAILGSLALMILMEIVTAIYKNISEGNFRCSKPP